MASSLLILLRNNALVYKFVRATVALKFYARKFRNMGSKCVNISHLMHHKVIIPLFLLFKVSISGRHAFVLPKGHYEFVFRFSDNYAPIHSKVGCIRTFSKYPTLDTEVIIFFCRKKGWFFVLSLKSLLYFQFCFD